LHSQEHQMNVRICLTIKAIARWNVNKYHLLALHLPDIICLSFHSALEIEDISFIEEILDTIHVLVKDCCDSQQAFGHTTIISSISELLGAHNGPVIEEKCLQCVAVLCQCGEDASTTHERNCRQFGESDVLESIVSAIQDHPESVPIITAGLIALRKVCSIPENVSRIQESSCCDHVTQWMTSNMHDMKICEAGCATLSSFVSKGNFSYLYRLHIGELLAHVLKRHLMNCKEILRSICRYLSGILVCADVPARVPIDIFPVQICGLLLEGWRRHLEDAVTTELICLGIQRLSDLSLTFRREFGVVGVIETILRGIKIHQKNARILPCAEAALRSLTQGCVENQERLSVTGGVDVLQSINITSTNGIWFSAIGQAE
jgi:hypothetical protein